MEVPSTVCRRRCCYIHTLRAIQWFGLVWLSSASRVGCSLHVCELYPTSRPLVVRPSGAPSARIATPGQSDLHTHCVSARENKGGTQYLGLSRIECWCVGGASRWSKTPVQSIAGRTVLLSSRQKSGTRNTLDLSTYVSRAFEAIGRRRDGMAWCLELRGNDVVGVGKIGVVPRRRRGVTHTCRCPKESSCSYPIRLLPLCAC